MILLRYFTGAHGIANGLDAVLNAAKILKDGKQSNIKLVFIGDGKLKPHLQKRARDEKLENCLFLDPVLKEKLSKVYTNDRISYTKGKDQFITRITKKAKEYYRKKAEKYMINQKFKLQSEFAAAGDQPSAIKKLVAG